MKELHYKGDTEMGLVGLSEESYALPLLPFHLLQKGDTLVGRKWSAVSMGLHLPSQSAALEQVLNGQSFAGLGFCQVSEAEGRGKTRMLKVCERTGCRVRAWNLSRLRREVRT